MGSHMLYVLMQAIVVLVCAYTAGALAMRERRLYLVLVAVGMYLILGATLIEVWADRFDWDPGALGFYIATMSIGVAAIASGVLTREGEDLEGWERYRHAPLVLVGIAVVLGLALAVGASSSGIVDSEGLEDSGLSGGLAHVGPWGWALSIPLLVGAVVLIVAGARCSLVRRDARGLWLWVGGILLVLWPFDIHVGELGLNPALLMFGLVMTYFGLQIPQVEEEGKEGSEEGEPVQTAMEKWLEEASSTSKDRPVRSGDGGEGEEGPTEDALGGTRSEDG